VPLLERLRKRSVRIDAWHGLWAILRGKKNKTDFCRGGEWKTGKKQRAARGVPAGAKGEVSHRGAKTRRGQNENAETLKI
jgi:hypothetical protein